MNKLKAHSIPNAKPESGLASQDVSARFEEGRALNHLLAISDALYPVREAVQAYAALAHLLVNQPHDHNDTPEAAELGRLLGLMNEGLAQRVALACAQAEAAQGALG